ncbi:dihydrolipoamide acetyltransferase family protein [Aneurinibacillus sp. Ricciae_BoGa-3]|uniref:dihydrolipoamide acetyltransferase family protein n=1 Tax=Aneurinibacillus sp. Ricciae_BoGa-3 TaxID=3022697 RepID=UPI0023425CEB|nr:dihydrolipoamide acetyltransferase family protein [Aneurinibacillus sp. Ricciae_BoGa-3]WCK55944.1 dihydrolipoamide acetyltransferase family protein [Aneurinibacillus sp. Ricciae_BoGa-3]
MATEVLMPQLGESVTEGTIARWLVKPGDTVKKYEPLCEVTTDKVNAEVPATVEGTITELIAQEGDTIAVGQLICYIETEAGSAQQQAAPAAPAAAAAPETKQETAAEMPAAGSAVSPAAVRRGMDAVKKQRYSPAVLHLAQEHNLDLSRIAGSGREGRITRKDVLAVIENGGTAQATQQEPAISQRQQQQFGEQQQQNAPEVRTPETVQPAPDTPTQSAKQAAIYPGDTEIPVSSIRKTIANRMVQSKHEAPHAWTMVEVDVTNLVQFRDSMKKEFKQNEGFNLTFMPFFIKAVVESIKEFPILNATWAGDKIIVRKNINISIAVATEDALYVPVIKDADQKSIFGLARAVNDLANKTRQGKLTMDDMSGGTFTVNNTGSFGSIQSMPIINQPQAAIISIESIVKRPVVLNGMIAIRDMVNLCLSLDHRVLDGLVCGRFLQRVKQRMEAYNANTSIY